jgi:outer membrane protein assembly factor BamB
MNSNPSAPDASANPALLLPRALRLWPGVIIVVVQWLTRFVVPVIIPAAMPVGVLAGLAGGVAVIVWWVFFSRARWSDRVGILVVIAAAVAATWHIVHPSISGGMMGLMLFVYVFPGLSLALVASALATRRLADAPRRAVMLAAILASCGIWTLVRTGGFSSDLNHDWAWRWAPTPEDRLVAHSIAPAPATSPAPSPMAPPLENRGATWSGFRGPNRDSVVRGVKIETNWSSHPPVEIWRQPVGPGWSSFAVNDGLIYTQEQRGEDEVVACYRLADGEPVWKHQDAVRFWESNAGPGPRGTPTLHQGRVYTFGATGVLNALDAQTGTVLWSRNAATDTKAKLPDWGFSSSPLAVGEHLIVATSGILAAYDLMTGAPRWTGPTEGGGYSSPHSLEIAGVRQIVFMSGAGATGFRPTDGTVLWQYPWKGFPIVQPAQLAEGDLLVSTGDTAGVRRIQVTHEKDTWTVHERWTSTRLKPYFNDYVVHRGHAFGFNSGALGCIDLADGERKWKGGRYGAGQLFLLADQDVVLVLSEQGDLALVSAVTTEFTELARVKALEGKTWNHPVLAGDVLLVRNDREMAAYRLKTSTH